MCSNWLNFRHLDSLVKWFWTWNDYCKHCFFVERNLHKVCLNSALNIPRMIFSGTPWSAFWPMADIILKQAPLSNAGVNVMGHMDQKIKNKISCHINWMLFYGIERSSICHLVIARLWNFCPTEGVRNASAETNASCNGVWISALTFVLFQFKLRS